MKTKIILSICLYLIVITSCDKNENSTVYSFTGKAQKGPFINGSNITLNELNADLVQTGKSFTTNITTDDGSFALNNIELNSNVVLLTANGFYFSEIYGELSGATLSLQSITDLSEKEYVSINVLTHVIKGRIENLVSKGMNYNNANSQAKTEFLIFLGVDEVFSDDFDDLDISMNEDFNAVLLSFSIILQRYTLWMDERPTLTAKLTQLLSKISSDFATDGIINDQSIIDALLYNISQLNLIDIRRKIEQRYHDLGKTVVIPNFEKYITKFQQKHSEIIYTNFTYPAIASPDPVNAPDGIIPNVLVPEDTVFKPGPYSIAAIIPLNKSLKVKFIGSGIMIGMPIYGWELIQEHPTEFTLNSQRQNELMTMLIYLEDTGNQGNATIEYYENNSVLPTFIKNITWQ